MDLADPPRTRKLQRSQCEMSRGLRAIWPDRYSSNGDGIQPEGQTSSGGAHSGRLEVTECRYVKGHDEAVSDCMTKCDPGSICKARWISFASTSGRHGFISTQQQPACRASSEYS